MSETKKEAALLPVRSNAGLGIFHDDIFLKNGTQTSLKTLQKYRDQNGDWPRRMMPIARDEPHPPTRDCPCKDCLPSFEEEDA